MAAMTEGTKEVSIKIHPLTHNPSEAWEELRKVQVVKKVQPLPLNMPVSSRAVRFVCMSDTHSLTSHLKFPIPPGDVFIHAGDFTRCGLINEIKEFNKFLGKLPHKYKVVTAGNHELTFDPSTSDIEMVQRHISVLALAQRGGSKSSEKEPRDLLTNCIYLEDSEVDIYGLKIYGTPWQPEFFNWAFNLPRGEACLAKWKKIPTDVDVLVTHSPPIGHGDFCVTGVRAGCVELLSTVQTRVKPKYHVFGHIHEGYGITTDGQTIFINCSTCNSSYEPTNLPIIFDIPLPQGYCKT
ncbi:UPF0046 protein T07D4.2-like isoform X3 [Tachypleus tridentatus]|uniref:UPF0046 protein T07D4.2-like isoform X3 n=1 Tax=Tachypleus tridentatus TaxID=6853 RepID=UPI003FD66AEE